MSLNIQTATGLLEIGGNVTKEKVVSALGYEPADKAHTTDKTVHVTSAEKEAWDNKSDFSGAYEDLEGKPNITENESGEVVYADESGNIIAKVAADGLSTTNVNTKTIKLDGEDLGERLDEIEASSLPNIVDNESDDLSIADEAGNVIVKIDKDGFKTTQVAADKVVVNGTDVEEKFTEITERIDNIDMPSVEGLATEEFVTEQIAGIVNSAPDALNTLDELAAALGDDENFATTVTNSLAEKASKSDLTGHTEDTDIHITPDERETWNAKSNFSGDYNDLKNAPDIKEDESGEVVYTDESGNIIAKIGANGFETTNVTAQNVVIDGTDIKESINAAQEDASEALRIIGTPTDELGKEDAPTIIEAFISFQESWNEESLAVQEALDKKAEKTYVDRAITEAQLGSTVDLSPYAKTEDVDKKLDTKANTEHSHEEYLVADDIANKADKAELHTHSNKNVLDGISQDKVDSWDNKSDFDGNYSSLNGKPNILDDESSEYVIADQEGNVIFRVDADGTHTTSVETNELILNGEDLGAKVSDHISYVGSLPENTTAESVVDYINLKTEGIPSDTALSELQNKVNRLEGNLNDFQTEMNDVILPLVTVGELEHHVASSTDGVSYVAEADAYEGEEIFNGMSFVIIPNKTSTTTAPTLSLNGIVNPIKRRLSNSFTTVEGPSDNWLVENIPVRVLFDGTSWVAEGFEKPVFSDLEGSDQFKIDVDDKLDETSENPVQNKVVASEINALKQFKFECVTEEEYNTLVASGQFDPNTPYLIIEG